MIFIIHNSKYYLFSYFLTLPLKLDYRPTCQHIFITCQQIFIIFILQYFSTDQLALQWWDFKEQRTQPLDEHKQQNLYVGNDRPITNLQPDFFLIFLLRGEWPSHRKQCEEWPSHLKHMRGEWSSHRKSHVHVV